MTEQFTADTMTSPGGADGDRLQQAAGDIVGQTTDTVKRRLDGTVDMQLTRAGDMLGSVAQAVRQGGQQLGQQQPQIAGFVDSAASQLDRVADHVRSSNPRDLAMDVEQFARRQPALFLGGALILGAVAARLLKASPAGGSGMQAGYTGGTTGYTGSSGYTGYTGGSTDYTGGSTGYTGGPTGVMGS